MKGIIEDLKKEWNKPNNGVRRLILINVIVFIAINLVWISTKFIVSPKVYKWVSDMLFMPAQFNTFLYRPWTLFTYSFIHEDFGHILWNMVALYWFGLIIKEFIGNNRVISIYVLGGIAGGLTYLGVYTLPAVAHMASYTGLIGASAGVYAIVAAAGTLLPDYKIHLLFIGEAKLKYVALAYVFLSLIASFGINVGGSVAHLGGALLGFIFVLQLKRGKDLGAPLVSLFSKIGNLFKTKPKMKTTYTRANANKAQKEEYNSFSQGSHTESQPNQEIIDKILDKISESGYESLSKEEKQILFRASQKK